MAEVYPSDEELLSIVSDAETGVEYIETGKSPYYLEFRRLLYRLLLATRRANDLRVYDEGGLDIGVKAGKFWVGTELVSYPGSSGNTLADDKDQIYVYLTAAGELVTNEYVGFPDMASQPHVRLAVVQTSGGDIVSITDSRSGHNIVVPWGAGGVRRVLQSHTADAVLSENESGSIHTNAGASGTVRLTLPSSPSVGTYFTFAVQAAQILQVDPGSAAIRDDSGQAVGKAKYCSTIGACLTVAADVSGDWVTVSKSGVWQEEA